MQTGGTKNDTTSNYRISYLLRCWLNGWRILFNRSHNVRNGLFQWLALCMGVFVAILIVLVDYQMGAHWRDHWGIRLDVLVRWP